MVTKYRQAIADARTGKFPGAVDKARAIGFVDEQLGLVSGDQLHVYEDEIKYERAAIAHGVFWDDHAICYADYKLRRYDAAIQACTAAMQATDSDYALFWRGMAYVHAGKPDAALQDLRTDADMHGPFASAAAIRIGSIYFDRHDNQGALDVLNKYKFLHNANQTDRGDVAVAYNNRCYAYLLLGKLEQAFSDCNASLRYGHIPDAYRKQQELIKRLMQ